MFREIEFRMLFEGLKETHFMSWLGTQENVIDEAFRQQRQMTSKRAQQIFHMRTYR